MSRQKGTASLSFNFEPQVSAPLDARDLVSTLADLTNENTFLSTDNLSYAYKGMKVTVTDDSTPENNGIYRLKALPTTTSDNWEKVGSVVPIATQDTVGTVKPDNSTTFVDENGTISAIGGSGGGKYLYPFTINSAIAPSNLIDYYNPNIIEDLYPAMTGFTTDNCTITYENYGTVINDTTLYKAFGVTNTAVNAGYGIDSRTGHYNYVNVNLAFSTPIHAGTINFSFMMNYSNDYAKDCVVEIICNYLDGTSESKYTLTNPTLYKQHTTFTGSFSYTKRIASINVNMKAQHNSSSGSVIFISNIFMNTTITGDNALLYLNASNANPLKATLANSTQFTIDHELNGYVPVADGTYNLLLSNDGTISAQLGTTNYNTAQPTYSNGLIWVDMSNLPYKAKYYTDATHFTLITDKTLIGSYTASSGAITTLTVNPYKNYYIDSVAELYQQKSINSDKNNISNLKVADFKSSAIATSISANPSNDKLLTEAGASDRITANNIIAGVATGVTRDGNNVTINNEPLSMTTARFTNLQNNNQLVPGQAYFITDDNASSQITSQDYLPYVTVLTVELDGSGDFTNLQDAINYLYNKISPGEVHIHLGNGTFSHTGILINTDNLRGISSIIITGKGRANTFLNYTGEATDSIFIGTPAAHYNNSTTILFYEITITRPDAWNGRNLRGISSNDGNIVLFNMKFVNVNHGMFAYENSKVICEYGIEAQDTGSILVAWGGGYIKAAHTAIVQALSNISYPLFLVASNGVIDSIPGYTTVNKLSHTIPNVWSQTLNTITAEGLIRGGAIINN